MRKELKYLQIGEDFSGKVCYNVKEIATRLAEEAMTLSLFEKCRHSRLRLKYAIVIFAIAIFYAAVCTPIAIWAYSDVLISSSVFLTVWDVVVTAVNYSFYWVSFAFMLYFVSRFTLKNSKGILGIYVGACAFLYVANLLSSCIMNGFSDLYLTDLRDILMYVAFDALQMAIAVWIAHILLSPAQILAQRTFMIEKASNPEATLKMPQCFPFTGVFALKNRLMRAAFFASMVSFAVHVLSRVIYDAFLLGAPRGIEDLLWMIFAYLSEIVACFVGYFVIILILHQLHLKEAEKKARFEKEA